MEQSNGVPEYEREAGERAVKMANTYDSAVIVSMFVMVLSLGFTWGHFASGDWEMPAFGIGCGIGIVIAIPVVLRARMHLYEARRRHMYMDRH